MSNLLACISKRLYLKASFNSSFPAGESETADLNIGYIAAEIKTNLDKTMFQEAAATAHDLKMSVSGSKYFLLCDFLDMTPISSSTTDIEKIYILRKAHRLSAKIRQHFGSVQERESLKEQYSKFLKNHPYSPEVFLSFLHELENCVSSENLDEISVLEKGEM